MSLDTRQQLRRELLSWDGFLALGAGSGLSPVAPGTMGTLVAIPLVMVMHALEPMIYLALLGAGFLFGVFICDRVGRRLGVSDHGAIVWDEVVGYALTMVLVPKTWPWLLAGFIAFRLFDILKPWPIRQIEKKIPGGLGVMVDDVLAAGYAIVLMGLIQWGLSNT